MNEVMGWHSKNAGQQSPKEGASYEKGEKNGKVNNVLSSVDKPRMY